MGDGTDCNVESEVEFQEDVMNCAAIALAALLLCPQGAAAADPEAILGILENLSLSQQKRLQQDYGSSASAQVRVAFRRQGDGEWQPFPNDFDDLEQLKSATGKFPNKIAWTVALDGKSIGHLESGNPTEWLMYSDVGAQLILPGSTLPRIGKPDPLFAQWTSDQPVPRPLILVSQPNVRDPQEWKPSALPASYLSNGIATLRKQGLDFKDPEIEVLKCYRSNTGKFLFALRLRHKPSDEPSGPERTPHWFVAGDSENLQFLGNQMMFIDAGDYANDGHVELVFLKSSYNHDGYILFDNDFRRSVEFSWHYQ